MVLQKEEKEEEEGKKVLHSFMSVCVCVREKGKEERLG
jgi:hypothetical protein